MNLTKFALWHYRPGYLNKYRDNLFIVQKADYSALPTIYVFFIIINYLFSYYLGTGI